MTDGDAAAAFQRDSGVATIRLSGEFDISNSERIRDSIDSLETGAVRSVVIDATHLQFLDSSALAALVGIADRFGGSVAVHHANAFVRRVIETSGLAPVLQLEALSDGA